MDNSKKRKPTLRETVNRMSLDELREGLRILQGEYDRRSGKDKFEPIKAWDQIFTR
jgi:hypothetical protein